MLPWAPSANEIWRSSRKGFRPYLSAKYRTFIYESKRKYLEQGEPRITERKALEATILLFPPHNRSYDVDNRVKPVLDVLTKCGLWEDDRYVRKITVTSCQAVEGGVIVVFVTPLKVNHLSEALKVVTKYGLRLLKSKKRGIL